MKVIRLCKELEDSVDLMGRTPKAIACAVIFVVLAGAIDRGSVCKVCDVSVPTLSKIETIVRSELKEKNLL